MVDKTPAIRLAGPADASLLAAVGARAFTDAFGHLYRPEDLAAFLTRAHSPAAWAALLADPELMTWLVATTDGQPIGYLVAGPCKLPVPEREADAGEIRQLYVLEPWQGAGLGSRLLAEALAWLAERHLSPVYVGVWSGNQGAQRLYARHDFCRAGEYEFPVGSQRDLEYILRRA